MRWCLWIDKYQVCRCASPTQAVAWPGPLVAIATLQPQNQCAHHFDASAVADFQNTCGTLNRLYCNHTHAELEIEPDYITASEIAACLIWPGDSGHCWTPGIKLTIRFYCAPRNTYMIWYMVFVAVFSSGRGHWAPPQVIGHDGHRYQLRLSDIGMLTTCP